ncbi:MAG: class I SAM-dependent methyltransferase [Pseudomonadota bacterium]|nr:class I SAM-dependent methyltransferase [Pseudomonadota bacterium]
MARAGPMRYASAMSDRGKQALVNEVFAKAANRYDQMNDLMSGGLHRLWKDDFVAGLNLKGARRPVRCLDVAGGTGDIALRLLAEADSDSDVVVADISAEMVAQGRQRAHAAGAEDRCRFIVANAEALAFPERHFDCYTIAFGIRNVAHIDRALEEAYRVLKPGGRFRCLEFSRPAPALDPLYDLYSSTVIPAMGKMVTGDGAPYRYLVDSIRAFPGQEALAAMIAAAGFARVAFRNLTGGIVAIHSGWRL